MSNLSQTSSPKAYALLDSGKGRKLEQVGPVRIERQASLALWEPKLDKEEWRKCQAVHVRSEKGGGHWDLKKKFPESWITQVGPFELHTKLTSFGHLGFFVEQLDEWKWFMEHVPQIKERLGRAPRILNLFGYTGCSSLALAIGGAEVTHVDAAKGIVDWGRDNQKLNSPQVPQDSIRWIIEDCQTFVEREARRGNKYDGVILDPPSYGRGPKNQVFKIEDNILPLLNAIAQVLEPQPALIHFCSHTPGFTARVLENLLRTCIDLSGMKISQNEMIIHSAQSPQHSLPSGICVKAIRL
jgi:23S rRNA (cytosine1962-C5)-methyltransferase